MNFRKVYTKLLEYKIVQLFILPITTAIFLFLITMFFQFKNIVSAVNFLIESTKISALTILIILALLYLFYGLFNSLYYSITTTSIIVLLIGIVNEIKKAFLNISLTVWDVYQIKQAILIAPGSIGTLNFILAIAGIVISVALLIWIGIKFKLHSKIKYKSLRIIFVVFSLLFLILIVNNREEPINTYLNKLGVKNQTWNVTRAANQQGIILNLAFNLALLKTDKPENYSAEKIKQIINELDSKPTPISETKPDIIVMMSEAFYDIHKINVFKDNVDYIPTARKNQIGQLYVSEFGGGTANVEFEVLTSMSMAAYEKGITPYNQFIRKEIPTLPSYLKSIGYETSGFHTHYMTFYNRGTNYKLLGFDNIIFRENIENPEYSGRYISDKFMTDMIMNQLDSGKDQPQFIFALTMQNHLHYRTNREGDIETKKKLSKNNRYLLKNYTLGIHESDEQLLRLIKYIQKRERPTVLYFFGDHLPNIGNNFGIYTESKYISTKNSLKWTEEETKKMYATPLVSFSNFPIKREKDFNEMSANYLAIQILNELNLNNHSYPLYNFAEKLRTEYPIYTALYAIDQNGKFQNSKIENEWAKKYEMLQYDILLGKRYALDEK